MDLKVTVVAKEAHGQGSDCGWEVLSLYLPYFYSGLRHLALSRTITGSCLTSSQTPSERSWGATSPGSHVPETGANKTEATARKAVSRSRLAPRSWNLVSIRWTPRVHGRRNASQLLMKARHRSTSARSPQVETLTRRTTA